MKPASASSARRMPAAPSATVATLGANTTGYTDAGPFTNGNVYYYRVIATGAAGDSAVSNEVSFDAVAGFVEFSATKTKVNKTAGTACAQRLALRRRRRGGDGELRHVQLQRASPARITPAPAGP